MVEYNKEYDRELKDILEKHGSRYGNVLRSKGARGRCKDMTYLMDYIYACTKELVDTDDFTYSLATRLYWTINKIESFEDERTHCQLPECGKPIEKWNIVKLQLGYKKTCCKECERKLAQQHTEERMMRDYGVKNAFQLKTTIDNNNAHKDELQAKKRATRLKHFGDENFNNSEQANRTKLKKYKSVWNIAKIQETKLKNHGDPNWSNPEKVLATKKANGTFNTSKDEELVLFILKQCFNKVLTQHKTEEYPFACDFYIPSIDTYVELNCSWTHGQHAYDENSEEDKKTVEEWKAKNSKYYDNAIKTWTLRDVTKRNTAKANNLNYVEIWRYEDIVDLVAKYCPSIMPCVFIKKRHLLDEYSLINKYDLHGRKCPRFFAHNKIVKFFQQNVFYAKEKELFQEDNIRNRLIENRCKELSKTPDQLEPIELLDGFKKAGMHYGYSHFNPLIFKWFIQNFNIKTCYDPCGGWGHRLLGSSDLESYIYNDLSKQTKDNVDEIIKFFKIKNAKTYCEDARTFNPEEQFEAMFTCPPYFNLEKYQCKGFDDLRDYENFIDSLFKLFENRQDCKLFGLVTRDDMLFSHTDYVEKHLVSVRKKSYLPSAEKKHNEYLYIYRKEDNK